LDATTLVTRPINGGDALINFGNFAWQGAAAASIIKQCKDLNMTGLYHDEVDWVNEFAWPTLKTRSCVEFPTEQSWKDAYVGWLKYLQWKLYRNGLKLWINLGANYDTKDPWQIDILRTANAVNIEFWMGREGVGSPPNNIEESWLSSVKFLSEAELNFGVEVHAHCSSLNQAVVDYAFLSWLAGTHFLGSFAASLNYGGVNAAPSSTIYANAQKLGQPTGEISLQIPGYYSRSFAGGSLFVNPNATATFNGMPPLSGKIVLK
jgi:hypothetical protein